jgi:phenylacetyl-CoA:acceptor oxidoreductase subunit 2
MGQPMNPAAPIRQKPWDWRAASNFVGASGSGALASVALARGFGTPAGESETAGLALGLLMIAIGLVSVWMEIGHPWRALNVLRHPQRSWMSREAWVAMVLFSAGALALWSDNIVVIAVTAALGLAFVYCQGRILAAAKGIPAWREPKIVGLIVATGLAEGTGVFAIIAATTGPIPSWLPLVLISLLGWRAIAFQRYHRALRRSGAPAATLETLGRFSGPFLFVGGIAAAMLAIAALLGPAAGWLLAVSGLTAFVAGATFKYLLIVRAAFTQGFALTELPTRGAAPPGSAIKPGWRLP